MRFPIRSSALALALSAGLLVTAPARAGDLPTELDPAQRIPRHLASLRMGAGIAADQVIVFPLFAPSEPTSEPVAAAVRDAPLVFSEPQPKLGRQTLTVKNEGTTATLLLAGTVVGGGRRDRVVRFDRVIPAGEEAEVEMMPGAMARDVRPKAAEFRIADFLAPSYLRESGQFTSDASAVPRFISHFLEFRNPSDTRKSLLAIGDSDALADYCLMCQRSFAEWGQQKGPGSAVGGILVVRGRLQSMEVFETNVQLRAFLAPLLKSLAFPAAAIALRAKKLEIPLPENGDGAAALAAATKASEELLASLGGATYTQRKTDASRAGEAWVIRLKDGTRGSAILREGRLMHAAVYPGDPLEDALYSKPLDPLEPEDLSGDASDGVGQAELERLLARSGRITPAEQRLLDRMRERRAPR